MIVVIFLVGMIKSGLSATHKIRKTKARLNKSLLPYRTLMDSVP